MDLPGWAVGVGIGAGCVYAVARDFVPYFTRRVNGTKPASDAATLVGIGKINEALRAHFDEDSTAAKHIGDLHRWHDVRDNEGIPVWYVRRSLESAILKLTDAVDRLAAKIQT